MSWNKAPAPRLEVGRTQSNVRPIGQAVESYINAVGVGCDVVCHLLEIRISVVHMDVEILFQATGA